MEQSSEKFLDFKGKNIYFKSFDGQWWIAIKPICEALGVDYKAQHKAILRNEILGRVSSVQTIHDASFRLQEMTCLPEFFVYGWLFKIQSSSPQLEEYQFKCYEILHNYFHGTITGRTCILKEKTKRQLEIERA